MTTLLALICWYVSGYFTRDWRTGDNKAKGWIVPAVALVVGIIFWAI